MSQPPIALNPLWTSENTFGALNESQPLVLAGDRVIIVSQAAIFARDIYSGAPFTLPNGLSHIYTFQNPYLSAPYLVYANNSIFFVDNDLQAISLVDGSTVWHQPSITQVQSLEVIDQSLLTVYADSQGATWVEAFDLTSGRSLWPAKEITQASPGLIGYGNEVIFFTAGSTLYAVNAGSGDTRWSWTPPSGDGPLTATRPVLADKTVVCVGESGVYGIDLNTIIASETNSASHTGKMTWHLPVSGTNLSWSAPIIAAPQKLVVVSNSQGDLYALDWSTGNPQWHTQDSTLSTGQPIVAEDSETLEVYTLSTHGSTLFQFNLTNINSVGTKAWDVGAPTPQGYPLPIIGNGCVFVLDQESLVAKAYGSEAAARFNGTNAQLDIAAEGSWFDHSSDADFSIETWVRSSQGGDLLSSYPTQPTNGTCGLRLNLSEAGELQFAIISGSGETDADLAQSIPTNAADGFWHHIALCRRSGEYVMYIDGIASPVATLVKRDGNYLHANGYQLYTGERHSQLVTATKYKSKTGQAALFPNREYLTPAPAPTSLSISGNSALTIGACVSGSGQAGSAFFNGLLREFRIWSTALSAENLQSRMKLSKKILPPNTAHLLGNWHLDEDLSKSGIKIKNDVVDHEYPATNQGVTSIVTDLMLDDSAFPFLLEQPNEWPYSGHWAVRGESGITATPAVHVGAGVACFRINDVLYGVKTLNGKRCWEFRTAEGLSAPVAFGTGFYVLTGEYGLVCINPVSGNWQQVGAFDGLFASGTPSNIATPAVGARYIAAASPNKEVWIQDRIPNGKLTKHSLVADATCLKVVGSRVLCVAGSSLNIITPAAAQQVNTTPIDSSHLYGIGPNGLYCVQSGNLVLLNIEDLTTTIASSNLSGITSLTVSADADLVVVVTEDGTLHRLSSATLGKRWDNTGIPLPPDKTSQSLHQPCIDGRNIYCTSDAGAVAAVDGTNGDLRGSYYNAHGITTPPVAVNGTVYFGGADASATSPTLDGALHSIVFGETYALRLGVETLEPIGPPNGYASITQGEALQLRVAPQCCVEAWMNTGQDGTIVAIAPSSDHSNSPDSGPFKLRLWLEKGLVQFSLVYQAKQGASWQSISARQNTTTNNHNRQWHHVAVSCQAANDIRLFIDGIAQDVTITSSTTTPPTLQAGIQIVIGAELTTSGPKADFQGLIADVRMWNTFLVAHEISSRMHIKLRGNEPDLLADWNFDRVSVFDTSPNAHHGTLTPSDETDATFWLTDLAFEKPFYPYIGQTKGKNTTNPPSGKYQLTIPVHAADGSPLTNTPITIWYVNDLESDPPTIQVSETGSEGKLLHQLDPKDETQANGYQINSGSLGQVVLNIDSTLSKHGPALDIWASFMPQNERLRINTLVDSQNLPKPAPPRLIAQSKLIQDYAYQHGDTINSSRSKATYRTIISAKNGDGSPRPYEPIELWAKSSVQIQVHDVSYPVNQENSQSFHCDESGELTVVVDATAPVPSQTKLTQPALSACAGFMNRNDWVIIPIDQDAHTKLAAVQGTNTEPTEDGVTPSGMGDTRMTNWKPKSAGGPVTASPLTGDYQKHANDVASSVRNVMAVTKTKGKPGTKKANHPPSLPGAADPPVSGISPMRQPSPSPIGDQVMTLRSLRHGTRRMPITPEFMKESLAETKPKTPGIVCF